jgi:hypothetical protein
MLLSPHTPFFSIWPPGIGGRQSVRGESPLADPQPLTSVARNRLGSLCAFPVKPFLSLVQPCAPTLAARNMLGQLIAAGGIADVVLGLVDAAGLLEDLRRDLVVAADRLVRGRGSDLLSTAI